MSRRLFFLLWLGLVGSVSAAQDPTLPSSANGQQGLAAEQPVAGELVLQAIVRRAGHARAVLNGQSLAVGEELAGVRLLAIHANGVTIEREGRRELLRLAQPIVKPSR